MSTKIGINGFGRIGRLVFRALVDQGLLGNEFEVVAINDLVSSDNLAYSLKYDSTQGRFNGTVEAPSEDSLVVNGQEIRCLALREGPAALPWGELGVDVVIEATGKYRSRERLQKHLDQGADRVILSTPPTDDIDHLHIRGVTDSEDIRSHRIISCGSSTSNATALLVKVLDDAFGITEGSFTSVQAYTADQSLTDVPSPGDLRRSRAAMQNIIPQTTWTDHAIEKLFPHLEGRFKGMKLNVPVPGVSCCDLTVEMKRSLTAPEVNEVFRSAAASIHSGYLSYTDQPIVSSDIGDHPASCVFDSMATLVTDGVLLKVLGWYEQGGGIAHRIVELAAQMSSSGSDAGERKRS